MANDFMLEVAFDKVETKNYGEFYENHKRVKYQTCVLIRTLSRVEKTQVILFISGIVDFRFNFLHKQA